MLDPSDRRWHQAPRGEAQQLLKEAVERTLDAEKPRLSELARLCTLFEERKGQFGAQGLGVPKQLAKLPRNLLRSLVRTAQSRILATRPRPFYCSDGADFDIRQQLEQLNEAITGLFLATQADQHASLSCLHGALGGAGALKVYAKGRTPSIERVYPWEVYVDPLDGLYGKPRTLYQVRWIDRPVLLSLYPRLKKEIREAPTDRAEWAGWTKGLGAPIRVVEAWRLPDENGEGGRHIIALDNVTLRDEAYTAPAFPIVIFRWTDSLSGYWPQGLGQELYGAQIEVNRLSDMLREIVHRCAMPRTYIEETAKVPSAIIDNVIGAIVRYRGNKPVTESGQGLTAETRAHLLDVVASMYETSGISQYAAASMKPAGITSGRGLRVFADQQDGRLRDPSEKWQAFYIELGQALVRVMREIAQQYPDATLRYTDPKTKSIKQLRWAEVDIPDAELEMICQPISALPSTPAARAAALEELFNAGVLSLDEFREALDLPDLAAIQGKSRAPRRAMEKLLGQIVTESAEHLPEPFYPLELCLSLGLQTYCQALIDEAPESVLTALRAWCTETTNYLDQRAKAAAGMPAAPPGMPPPEAPTDVPPEALAA
jgi:hypothetical protein